MFFMFLCFFVATFLTPSSPHPRLLHPPPPAEPQVGLRRHGAHPARPLRGAGQPRRADPGGPRGQPGEGDGGRATAGPPRLPRLIASTVAGAHLATWRAVWLGRQLAVPTTPAGVVHARAFKRSSPKLGPIVITSKISKIFCSLLCWTMSCLHTKAEP